MNSEPAIVPQLLFDIFDRADQDISIEVVGRDVLEFEPNRKEKSSASNIALPDPVLTLVAAAERGTFAHALTDP